ncbi:MAG TPA: hypothetical protein PJ993_03240 [Candidatus Saccharibacteria bacterium]|nr:hypothetical protein [Candidatus Saccharibacteria bacterium]HMT39916.1 hypothetical protein [Candidatus Saccharibacteria bacterium]
MSKVIIMQSREFAILALSLVLIVDSYGHAIIIHKQNSGQGGHDSYA